MNVGVIIPTFRRPKELQRALISVLQQTRPAQEVFVVDDGPDDETAQVARSYPGVTLIQQFNAGSSAARNRGLRASKSELIASLDHDDEWDSDFLSKCIAAMEQHSADVAWANFRQKGDYAFADFLKTDRSALRALHHRGENSLLLSDADAREFYFFACGSVSNSALTFRRQALGSGWDEFAKVADDLLLMARLLSSENLRYVFLPQPLWTKHEDVGCFSRDSESTVRKCLTDFGSISRMAQTSFSRLEQRKWQTKTGNLRYKLAYHAFWNSGLSAAQREAQQAFAEAGLTPYALKLLVIACLRKCARLAGLPPLSQLTRRHLSGRAEQSR